ncbi:hypothetical protein DL93DRAFT_2086801 [Clavulina sp. PMI_390]|nr:hypothetical protein DL93DRAFT_2086801 [Clavulina sp. PMI_390]
MGYTEAELKRLWRHEHSTKRESPMKGKGSRGSCRAGLAPHHTREPSGIGCGSRRTIAMLLNAAVLTFKYPEGSKCGPHGYERPQHNRKLSWYQNIG